MTHPHFRQKRSISNAHLPRTTHPASTLSWKACILVAALSLMIFYGLIPAWLNHQMSLFHDSMFRPIIQALLVRRISWIQWVGITLCIIFTLLAIRNYSARSLPDSTARSNMHLLRRLLIKLIR